MGLALFKSEVSRSDVEVVWATYRALVIAEVDDPKLLDDDTHQLALKIARDRFQDKYREWVS